MKTLKDGSVSRSETAVALASIGSKGIQSLIDILRTEGKASAQVRIAAAYGLSHVDVTASSSAVSESIGSSSPPPLDGVVECLFAASRDRLPGVRKAVLESLSALGRVAKETVTYLRTRSLLPFFCFVLSFHSFSLLVSIHMLLFV